MKLPEIDDLLEEMQNPLVGLFEHFSPDIHKTVPLDDRSMPLNSLIKMVIVLKIDLNSSDIVNAFKASKKQIPGEEISMNALFSEFKEILIRLACVSKTNGGGLAQSNSAASLNLSDFDSTKLKAFFVHQCHLGRTIEETIQNLNKH